MAWLHSLPTNQEPPATISDACQKPAAGDLGCGKEIFEARCAVCHGPQGQGKEGSGTDSTLDFNNSGPDEVSDPWYQGMALWKGDVRHLDENLHITTVRNGRRFAFMPAWAEAPAQGIPPPPYPLTDEQILAVVAYERSL
jgi:mono/diheme cytochrome c family protein